MGAGGLAVLLGGGILFEWMLRDPSTIGSLPGHLIQPLTATCSVAAGIGVLVVESTVPTAGLNDARIAAGGLLCVGVAVCAEYMVGIDLESTGSCSETSLLSRSTCPFPEDRRSSLISKCS